MSRESSLNGSRKSISGPNTIRKNPNKLRRGWWKYGEISLAERIGITEIIGT